MSNGTAANSGDRGFASTYESVVRFVQGRYDEAGLRHEVPVFDSPNVAQWSLLSTPLDSLMSIDGDDEFVVACYTRLLNRLPGAPEITHYATALQEQTIARAGLIERFLESEEYAVKGVRVEFA